MVTAKDYIQMCYDFSKSANVPSGCWLPIPMLGILEELGELTHPFKSYFLSEDQTLDVQNLKEEIGDVFFVVTLYQMRCYCVPDHHKEEECLIAVINEIEDSLLKVSSWHKDYFPTYGDKFDLDDADAPRVVSDVLARLSLLCINLITSLRPDEDIVFQIFKYLSIVCRFIDTSLEEVIEQNYRKIKARFNIH